MRGRRQRTSPAVEPTETNSGCRPTPAILNAAAEAAEAVYLSMFSRDKRFHPSLSKGQTKEPVSMVTI